MNTITSLLIITSTLFDLYIPHKNPNELSIMASLMVSDSCWCVGVQLYFISFNQFHEYVLSDHRFTLDNIFKSFHHGHQYRNNDIKLSSYLIKNLVLPCLYLRPGHVYSPHLFHFYESIINISSCRMYSMWPKIGTVPAPEQQTPRTEISKRANI